MVENITAYLRKVKTNGLGLNGPVIRSCTWVLYGTTYVPQQSPQAHGMRNGFDLMRDEALILSCNIRMVLLPRYRIP
jgi:hypothetical protein